MRTTLLAAALLSAGCATPAQRLHGAVENWFEEDLRENPLKATYIGDHRFDDQLGNPASPEAEARARASWQTALDAVKAVDPAALDEDDRLTREVFLHNAEVALEGYQYPERLLPVNQMDNLALELAKFGSGEGPQPLGTVDEHERWLKRASGFAAWADAAIADLKEGEARGVTEPRVAIEKTVAELDELCKPPLESTVFWKPVAALNPADRAALEPKYRDVFGGHVLPAMQRLRDYLRDQHLAKARASTGWSALPNGDAWYRWHVKDATTTQLSPDEIHQMGLAEVARIRSEMEKVRVAVHFAGTLSEFFVWARTNPAFYFDKPDDLFNAYAELKKKIDAALPSQFSLFPKADYVVRPVEAFRAASAPGGEYQQPSADGSRPGIFYVNTFNLKAQPKYGMQTLSLHEASPGHHFQVSLQQELTRLPRFRRFGGYVAYEEGWALYAETLGKSLGLFQDPMDYYGHLADAQLRAMRLVVDTGLHSKGWSREQAIQYMLDNSSMAESDVTAEVERYMVWPGQALGYKVGQLRILAMRKHAEEVLGPKFDVKAFHAQLLDGGALPMDVLESKIQRWIDSRR